MSRPEAGLEELRNAFDRAVYGAERRAWIIGLMGMQNTDGTVSLAVPDRTGFVFVTTGPSGNQIVTIARNDGKVPLRNNMPIRMKRADDGVLVIYGVFNAGGFTDSGMADDYDNNFGVDWHHHRIGSGLEFEWEALMLEQARAYPTTGMLAYMNPFRYYHGGEWKTFEGGTFDLTGYQPVGVGTHAWVIIGVNPEDSSAVAVTGPSIAVATDLTLTDANDVDFVGIPVAAVKVRNDSSSIQDIELFKDVHEWFAGLHYSELGDLGNVNTKDGYLGIGPYWNDELYYHGYDGYDWLTGGHRQNFGNPKVDTITDGHLEVGKYPSWGMVDVKGEGDADDDLVTLTGGKVGDMIVLFSSDPSTNGEITLKSTGNINIPADMLLDATSKVAILVLTYNGWMSAASVPSTLYDFIDFDTTYADGVAEGRLQWNIEDGTLEVGLPGGTVNLQLGQEMVIRCRNTTGVTIPNGSVVEVIGASGNKPLISLADASDLTKISVIGLTTEAIDHNTNGYVTSVGFVREVNTNGMTIGEPVWLSEITPGAYTQTRPTAPDFSFAVGVVIAAHTTEGVLYVGSTPYLPIMSASDVLYDAAPADGEFLVYNLANGRFELSSAVAHALTDHTDVTIAAPAENDTLHYDGAGWINKVGHRLNMQDREILTISAGAIDIGTKKTDGYFDIRGEGSVDDDLNIITGGNIGDIIHLSTYAATTYGDITVTNNNNIQVPSTSIVLNSQSDGLTLVSTTWGWFPISIDKRLDGATVTVPASIQVYIDKKERLAQESLFGGIASLAIGQPLDSVPTDLPVTAGIGKLLVAVNVGSDTSGSILVTGTSVDRDTGAETPADTDTLTIAGVTTDGSSTDGNGNITYSFTNLYITSKWFRGAVTLSTADLTLTDVDVYQVAFYQFGDYDDITLDYLDVTALPTNSSAWMDVHLYSLEITGTDKCSITKEATLEELAAGITANVPYRKRKGALAKALDGSTDGIWINSFLGPLANTYWDDITIIVGYLHLLPITPGV